jgi:CelD/BcsL family acetyltransferase involved in cellulose biosynthesis
VGYETRTLTPADVDPELARAWDGLVAGRGLQADVYDSHAWLAAWWDTAGRRRADAVRIPAVLDGDRPLGLLPLTIVSGGRWEFAGRGGGRMRYRPVIGSEQPDQEVLGLLADQVGRAGARDLALPRLPGRDPATRMLAAGLREAGFRVYLREKSSDCLALVEGGWEEHRRRFAGYERSVKRFANRLRPLWDVTLDEYGPTTGASVVEGYRLYADVLARSWKVSSPASNLTQHQLELLRRSERLGWPRVYVLRVAGQAVAAHVWFRLGPVASWLETAYDQRLAAIGPGSILMWWSQERIFAESPPRVVDFIPGHNPQKDRLGPDRTPMVFLEAVRPTPVSGITFPARRQARYVAPAVTARVRRKLRRLRNALPARGREARVGTIEIAPGPAELPMAALELDASVRRFLASVTGHHSPDAMAERWAPGDTWWRVGADPVTLVRVGAASAPDPARPVREIVLFGTGYADQGDLRGIGPVLAALAAGLAGPVHAGLAKDGLPGVPTRSLSAPTLVSRALLPWPDRDAEPWVAARSATRPGPR